MTGDDVVLKTISACREKANNEYVQVLHCHPKAMHCVFTLKAFALYRFTRRNNSQSNICIYQMSAILFIEIGCFSNK